MPVSNEMVTTTFDIPNHKIVKIVGVVRGISVRSTGALGGIKAGFQSMFKGKVSEYTQLCEDTREEAYQTLLSRVQELGANAIIGYRYDANEIAPGVTEVLAYGTAVIAEPIK